MCGYPWGVCLDQSPKDNNTTSNKANKDTIIKKKKRRLYKSPPSSRDIYKYIYIRYIIVYKRIKVI